CGRRMGVGAALFGKRIRCPHCKQISVAPSGAEAPVTAPTPDPPGGRKVVVEPAVVPKPPSAPAIPPLPQTPGSEQEYVFQEKEAAESILSDPEESEDDLFGSHSSGRAPAIEMPDALPPAHPPVVASMVPTTAEPEDPWSELDATSASQSQPAI